MEFPANVYEIVRDNVMRAEFYRKDSYLVFTLRHADVPHEKYGMPTVLLDVEICHDIANLVDEDRTYPARFFVERDPSDPGEPPRIEIIVDGETVPPNRKWQQPITNGKIRQISCGMSMA